VYKFDAVAFDLDGTLYPNYRFYALLIPFVLKEQVLIRAFGKARNMTRAGQEMQEQDFYDEQARVVGELLGKDPLVIKKKIETLIYRGWEPLFKKIKLFNHVHDTLSCLKEHGFKLGLLSDFPTEQKLKNLHLEHYWDTVVCSEVTGRLKPAPVSFLKLAENLSADPQRILYVGNSVRYDVAGARNVGMKTGLKVPFYFPFHFKGVNKPVNNADFTFHDYRQLCEYVLR
jgi:putative hydrolase of the HAD superfamily